MFERMLAAVDDSVRSSLVADVACALARRSGGALTLLRVRPQTAYGQVSDDDLELAEHTRELRAAGIAAHYLIHIGPPERQIIETAQRQRASLIILGARSAGLWPPRNQRMSQRLLVHAPVPLLVIPAPDTADQAPRSDQPGDQLGDQCDQIFGAKDAPILAALDGSDLAEWSLPAAAELAHLLDRPLVLLRVASQLDTEKDLARARVALEAAQRRVREGGASDLRMETQVVSGATVEELLWAIEGRRAGALALTALGISGADGRRVESRRHASPITRELLSKLPIPALVIPTAALAALANPTDAAADAAREAEAETERIP